VVTGNLVCGACSRPYGTPRITGHAATETWTPGRGTTAMSVTQHPPALRSGVTVTPVPLLTRVRVDYPLGPARSRPAAQARCAGEPDCRVVRAQQRFWFADVHRNLTCGAVPAGDYRDPARACRALHALAAAWPGKPDYVCACPGVFVGARHAGVHGTVLGAHIDIPLDPCALCGLGAGAERAAQALM
jgi:hypothetical protein